MASTKPATTFNRELLAKYEKNIFSVMEEVWASDDERIDLVIFLNGLAIMSFELKCNAAGQSYAVRILADNSKSFQVVQDAPYIRLTTFQSNPAASSERQDSRSGLEAVLGREPFVQRLLFVFFPKSTLI